MSVKFYSTTSIYTTSQGKPMSKGRAKTCVVVVKIGERGRFE